MNTEDVRRHFDQHASAWTDFYGGNPISDYLVQSRLLRVLNIIATDTPPNGVVVEAGCGSGQLLAECTRVRADVEYSGFDLSPEMLSRAERQDRVSVGDIMHLPVEPRSADIAVAVAVAEYLPDWQSSVARLAEIVRPGGKVIMTFAHRRSALSAVDRFYRRRYQRTKDTAMQRVQVDVGQVRTAFVNAGLTNVDIRPMSFDLYCLRYILDRRPRLTAASSRLSWFLDRHLGTRRSARVLGRALLCVGQVAQRTELTSIDRHLPGVPDEGTRS